ncbi:MAG: DUF5317 family protein [Candidatus Limnocylindria bacterium]
MLASAIALGVAAGWVAGGRTLRRLGEVRIRWWPLLVVAVGLRALAPLFGELSAAAYVAAFASIAIVALVDRRLPGMTAIAAGATLNTLVVAANGGMPVDAAAVASAGAVMPADRLHIDLTPATRLPQLADVIPMAVFRNVYSVGDVLLAAGGFWLPFAWMRRR